MRHLTGLLPHELKQEIYALWEVFSIPAVWRSWVIMEVTSYCCDLQEYETQSSPEARLVKEFDLLEMILQAYEYEELEGTPGRLQEFFDSTNGIAQSSQYLYISSLALTSLIGFQVVSTTPTCFSSLDRWVNRGDATWQKQTAQRFLRSLSGPWSSPPHCRGTDPGLFMEALSLYSIRSVRKLGKPHSESFSAHYLQIFGTGPVWILPTTLDMFCV